ncbi:MAG: hypothetical protein JWQ96_2281 [Segetibacter sp.]|nr:hypothetical protein [Segetibacter sp.]
MIAETSINPKKETSSPFIGLNAYTEDQTNLFFGRGEEIKTLYKLIKANALTIVFGKSGTGKTSLLNAGVFPKLREDYCLPIRIRLEFTNNCPDLITQVKAAIKDAMDVKATNKDSTSMDEFRAESYPNNTETLWEYFHRESLWEVVTPVLVFDQFEEIFTLANKSSLFKKEKLENLIQQLSDLIENSMPKQIKDKIVNNNLKLNYNYNKQKCKVLFAFREDFLPEIESITARIPSAKNSRFRLRAMTSEQGLDVILNSWPNAIDLSEAKKIVSLITEEAGNSLQPTKYGLQDTFEVEPSLLSQVCTFLDKEKNDQGLKKVSSTFLDKYPKGVLLRSLYNEVLEESLKALNTHDQSKAVLAINPIQEFIEEELITDEGFRTKYSTLEIDEKIKPGINVLRGKYFIREEGQTIELTHDVIVTLVKTDREERRKKAALRLAHRKAKRRSAILIVAAVLICSFIYAGTALYKKTLDKDIEVKDSVLTELNNTIELKKDTLSGLDSAIDQHPKPFGQKDKGKFLNTKLDSTSNLTDINASDSVLVAENNRLKDELQIATKNVDEEKLRTNKLAEVVKAKDKETEVIKRTHISDNEKNLREISNFNNERKTISQQLRNKENDLKQKQSELLIKDKEIATLNRTSRNLQQNLNNKIDTLEGEINFLKERMASIDKSKTGKNLVKGKLFGYGYDYHSSLKRGKLQKK